MHKDTTKKALLQAIIDSLSERYRRILDYMLIHSIKNINNFVSQSTISRVTGLSISTIKRAIKYFYQVGIITYKKQRGLNKSNLYQFNELLFVFKDLFSTILPCLKWCKKELHKPVMYLGELLSLQGRRVIYNSCRTMIVRVVKKLKKDGVVMERAKPILSDVAKKISKALNLTLAGQLKLLVLPEKALIATWVEYQRRNNLSNPFFWFLTYAKGWCIQQNIHVDYSMWSILKKQYNIPDKPEWVAKEPIKLSSYPTSDWPVVDSDKEASIVDQAIKQGKVNNAYAVYAYPNTKDQEPTQQETDRIEKKKAMFSMFFRLIPQSVQSAYMQE